MTKRAFITPLTEEECLSKLEEELLYPNRKNYQKTGYMGKIKGNKFVFWADTSFSFLSVNLTTSGSIIQSETGTKIEFLTTPSLLNKKHIQNLGILLLIISLIATIANHVAGNFANHTVGDFLLHWLTYFFIPALGFSIIGIIIYLYSLTRPGDYKEYSHWLRKTLKAKEL